MATFKLCSTSFQQLILSSVFTYVLKFKSGTYYMDLICIQKKQKLLQFWDIEFILTTGTSTLSSKENFLEINQINSVY